MLGYESGKGYLLANSVSQYMVSARNKPMIDIDSILDKAALRDEAVKIGVEKHQKQEDLKRELLTITSNRAHDMQFHIKTILENPSKYGLGEFEEILLALASRMWERANSIQANRLEEIRKELQNSSGEIEGLAKLQEELERPFRMQSDKHINEYREQLAILKEEI